MDGNGRWAKQRGLPRTKGHEAGEAVLFEVIEGAIELGIKYLSAYAFSTENWKRSPEEVSFLDSGRRDPPWDPTRFAPVCAPQPPF